MLKIENGVRHVSSELHAERRQLGDDKGVDGEIVDQDGPGAPGPVNAIRPASEWMLLMMAMVLAITGVWKLRC